MRHIALCLIIALTACNGSAGARQAYIAPNPPQAGTIEPFFITIQNNTQWELDLGIATSLATGQTGHLLIPPGSHATLNAGFLPSAVSVQAVTTAIPSFAFPVQTQTLGVNYGPYDIAISFGFP